MEFLLAAINAKYIHSNLGLYSLKRYAQERLERECVSADSSGPRIEIGEYTINHRMEYILQDIYRRDPDVTGFSCYIWNILYVREIVKDLKKIRPNIKIWLGGPEVSYDAVKVLADMPQVDGIIVGEGEESFYRLVKNEGTFSEVSGVAYRDGTGTIVINPVNRLPDLSAIPFSYEDLSGLEHRIIYYESSRGCPFSCSYCLSSIDRTVRFRDTQLVKRELSFFLERRVPQVKFVDRTFNCKKSHAMEIWQHILEHDNGITNFHFEISADLLDEEELALLKRMRPGLVQLEIGVQTTNPETIREIRRSMDLTKLKQAVSEINSFQNIHQHLDLIAGLPFEGYESFKRSFDEVYALEPEQLQLGFLKVLKGSYMEEMAENYGLLFCSRPPYEVLATNWLSYGDIIRLKGVEEMVEVYYNSGQFRNVLKALEKEFASPFELYEALEDYYRQQKLTGINHNRLERYEILYQFINRTIEDRAAADALNPASSQEYADLLMYDLYLRENVKSRPSFAGDQGPFKEAVKQFFISEAASPAYLHGYEQYDSRQMSKMAHIEVMADGTWILFDYLNRDALLGNASAVKPEPMTSTQEKISWQRKQRHSSVNG